MLSPKRIVHKKVHNKHGQSRRGSMNRGSSLENGDIGLMATETKWLTARQIEAARKVISKRCKGGKVYIRVFPSFPVTGKGLGAKMGAGVGAVDYFMVPIKPGRIIFEVRGISEEKVKEAFRIAVHKLPFACRVVTKNDKFN